MSEMENIELKFKLDRLIDLWRSFCESHTQLYEYTCDEYMHLLASEIGQLDETVQNKLELLSDINILDSQRNELTTEIMEIYCAEEQPHKLNHLLEALKNNKELDIAKQLEGLNFILLDVIEKIQEQNKKNQVFLNKAIHSLQDLRESFIGKTKYKTYSSMGTTRGNSTL